MNQPFQITTAHGTSTENFSLLLPSSELFKKPDIMLKYFLFHFHDHFDILLGLDNLKSIGATIDLVNDKIIIPTSEIKIQYHQLKPQSNYVKINANSEKIVKFHINCVKNGDILIPETKII